MPETQVDYTAYKLDLENYNIFKIKTKYYNKNNVQYKILNYDNELLCFDDYISSLYRSLIVSFPENKILSFSPQKSLEKDKFIEKYPKIDENIIVNEIIEGTMINLFYDCRIEKWEISTKSAIGGIYFYYRNHYEEKIIKQKTFYEMFLDAFRIEDDRGLNDMQLLNDLPKNMCYSFVLQHPDNHIVHSIKEPKVYLVGVYEINNSNEVKHIPINVFDKWKIFQNYAINFPTYFSFDTYDDIHKHFTNIQNDSSCMGAMIINANTGERTKIENEIYNEMKLLRGNNPNLEYQYLCLRRINKIKNFLNYFPQYKNVFYGFYYKYNNFVTNVHQSYVSYYVKKENQKISKKYFPHIYKIHHELYLPSLQDENEKLIIRRKIVEDYFKNLEPREMLYHLNYDARNMTNKMDENNNLE